jgi:hypothetical protein
VPCLGGGILRPNVWESIIDFLLEILVELLVELIGELLLELAFGRGWELLAGAVRRAPRAPLGVACAGYFLLGLCLGALSGKILPNRALHNDGLALLTLVANPAIAGMLARRYGQTRRASRKETTRLATFWGGAALAFGLSLGRILVLL